MSLSGQSVIVDIDGVPLWDLAPSPSRIDEIDSALRMRLVASLEYLGEFASLDAGRQAALAALRGRLKAGTVSPWVFCLYSRLVAELSKKPQGDVEESFDAVVHAASLPADQGVVGLRDPTVSESWWDHFQLLLDTDRHSPFRPKTPSAEEFSRCHNDIASSLELMQRIDPIWHDEVKSLLGMIVLGSPGSLDLADFFNGASTFFLWRAVLLNANLRRAPISMVDLLVHESSHVLLFGLAANGGLTRNSGKERYDSPVRADKRPIDGIFHACFVTTRVHLAMERLLGSEALGDEDTRLATEYHQHNGQAARESLDVLGRHAELTELGKSIFGTLRGYWANRPVG